jgi:hypothetical protein
MSFDCPKTTICEGVSTLFSESRIPTFTFICIYSYIYTFRTKIPAFQIHNTLISIATFTVQPFTPSHMLEGWRALVL